MCYFSYLLNFSHVSLYYRGVLENFSAPFQGLTYCLSRPRRCKHVDKITFQSPNRLPCTVQSFCIVRLLFFRIIVQSVHIYFRSIFSSGYPLLYSATVGTSIFVWLSATVFCYSRHKYFYLVIRYCILLQ